MGASTVRVVHVLRKPVASSIAANILEHGTGALHIDGCRVRTSDELQGGAGGLLSNVRDGRPWGVHAGEDDNGYRPSSLGRWPANLILEHRPERECPVRDLDGQSGVSSSAMRSPTGNPIYPTEGTSMVWNSNDVRDTSTRGFEDAGGASRFFKVIQESPVNQQANGDIRVKL